MIPDLIDAYDRSLVRLAGRGWVATVFYVDLGRRRAKVRLHSGSVLTVPLDELEVVERGRARGSDPAGGDS